MSQFFVSGGQSIGVSVSASVLLMNTQDRSPLRWTGWISLQSKGLSRVFTNTTVQKHQFLVLTFIVQLSYPYMTTGKTMITQERSHMLSRFEWEMSMTVKWGEDRKLNSRNQGVYSNLAGGSQAVESCLWIRLDIPQPDITMGKAVPDSYQYWLGCQWHDGTAFCKVLWPFS